jgi:hypothetical protein
MPGLLTTRINLADFLFARLFSGSRPDRELGGASLEKVLKREHALVEEFDRRMAHIPLVQQRTGLDDSVLGSARFADLEARPRRIIPTNNPAVTYVELSFRYQPPGANVHELNLGRARVYARIENSLYLRKRSHSIEHIRRQLDLREDYFRNIFTLINAQSECNRELGAWMGEFMAPGPETSDRDFLAAIQNFNHNINVVQHRKLPDRRLFREAIRGFDFAGQTPTEGPVSLRMAVRPHQRHDGCHGQSVTSLLLGTTRGIAFRKRNAKVAFIPPGNAFESRFNAFVKKAAREKLTCIARDSYRKSAEERIWGAQGECTAYFHNNDSFVMKGLEWRLELNEANEPKVMGTHRNVVAYCCGPHRVAVKAVPFESAGDLVRLVQAHQYVHGVQASALLTQAHRHPLVANEILTTVTSLLSTHSHATFCDAPETWSRLNRDSEHQFKRNLGPLLHQVTVDYEQKLVLAVMDWSEHGMLSDFKARKRLLRDCSLSHRLRMAANLLRNGHQLLEDDVTHTDLKPENILNRPDAAFRAQQKAREKGWQALNEKDLEALTEGEPILEGDFSGIHFGREGSVDNIAPGEGLPTSLHYSSWKFTAHGLSEGTQPSILKMRDGMLPRIHSLVLEQDVANRGTTAWEIVYGSLVDCIPPAEEARRIQARRATEERVGRHLDQAIRLKREGKQDPEVIRALEAAVQQCDRRLVDLVSMRSETIDNKQRITPLFQHARDNRHCVTVWLDPRVIDMLDHLACDFRRREISRQHISKLYRTAEALLRAEAGRLESADQRIAHQRRLRVVDYMHGHRLHLNPDSGLLGLPDLPAQLEQAATLVREIPDPRRALNEFAESWQHLQAWDSSVLEALIELKTAQCDAPVRNGDKGRRELHELVRSTIIKQHEAQMRLESRADEPKFRPPFLGLVESRVPVPLKDGGDIRMTYIVR